ANRCPRAGLPGNPCVIRPGGACANPNPWIEFLSAEGGRGLTQVQLSNAYHAEDPRHDMKMVRACRRARNTIRDRKKDVPTLRGLAWPNPFCAALIIPLNASITSILQSF